MEPTVQQPKRDIQADLESYRASKGQSAPVQANDQPKGDIRLALEAYRASKGQTQQPLVPKKSTGQKISDTIQSIFPGKQVGEAIGTLAGYIATPKENKQYYDLSAPSPLQVAGDVAQGALMLGTGGTPKPTTAISELAGLGSKSLAKIAIPTAETVGKRALQNTAVGAGYGGTGAIAEGKPIEDVVKESAIGGAAGLGLGLGIEGASKAYQEIKNISKPANIIAKRERELAAIDSNYANMRKASSFSKDEGVASRKRVASTDVLANSVDENGLIRTKEKGGAVDQYKAQTVDQAENVVRNNLERLGETVKVSDVEKELTNAVNASHLEGADLKSALASVKREVAGYNLKAKNGKIPLTLVHDAKVNMYKNIDYFTPAETKTYRKAIARGLKNTVEKNTQFNAKEVNDELTKYLEDIKFLERLDGKRVRGGKLGKYFSQISGNIIGGVAGSAVGGPVGSAVGTIIGGEAGGRIRGSMLSRTLAGKTGYVAPENKIIREAIDLSKTPYSNNLGNRNIRYNSTKTPSKIGIVKRLPRVVRKPYSRKPFPKTPARLGIRFK